METEFKQLNHNDIAGLQEFIDTIDKIIKKNNLDGIFNVRKQIVGPLGEARVLIRLYELFGEEYEYLWYGARRKDHDLVLRRNGLETRIQIKTSSSIQWTFSIVVKGFEHVDSIRKKLSDGDFEASDIIIESEIRKKNVDFWVFLHLPEMNFYILDYESIIESIKWDYHRYVSSINKRDPSNNKYAIVEKRKEKENLVRFIQKSQYLGTLWEKHLENWDIIRSL